MARAPLVSFPTDSLYTQVMPHDSVECTCLNLRSAARRVARRYDETLAPSGLSISQFSMMSFIAAKPSCGVAELAAQLDLDVSTATRTLRPLISGGYVSMRADSRDARRREIRITAKGRRALARARELWLRAQHDTRATLGEERSRELLAMLAALA